RKPGPYSWWCSRTQPIGKPSANAIATRRRGCARSSQPFIASREDEHEARKADPRAGEAHPALPPAEDQGGESHPCAVEGGSRHGEPGSVDHPREAGRHLRTVGVSVKEGEGGHQGEGRSVGKARRRGDEGPEDEDRGDDPRLDPGQVQAGQRQPTADERGADECCRQEPYGSPAALSRPDADGEGGEEMIPAEQGVEKAVREAMRRAVPGVGERRGREEGGCGREKPGGWATISWRIHLDLLVRR